MHIRFQANFKPNKVKIDIFQLEVVSRYYDPQLQVD